VWAVSPQNDSLEKFVTYTCSFAEEYLQTAKIACRLEVPEWLPEIILTADVRHNLFLVVKEALNNVVKHAAASEAKIQIVLEARNLILSVQDNGKGFLHNGAIDRDHPVSAGCQRDGLVNMSKRIESIAGKMELDTLPGRGTCVTLTIILENPTSLRGKKHISSLPRPSS